MSFVTVPSLGFGIRPRGPSTLPSLPTVTIMSGDAITRSKSIWPAWTFSARSSAPTMSAPALKRDKAGYAYVSAFDQTEQANIWKVRKAGLGLLLGMKGERT